MNNNEIKHNNQSILLTVKGHPGGRASARRPPPYRWRPWLRPDAPLVAGCLVWRAGSSHLGKLHFWNANVLVTPPKSGSQARRFHDQYNVMLLCTSRGGTMEDILRRWHPRDTSSQKYGHISASSPLIVKKGVRH